MTEADVDKLYRRPASLTDWLPWTDYEEASQTFTLEDGYSAAAMFEITGVSTEARSEQFLREVQINIQTCINHTIPAHDNPFVLQCFVADEDSLSSLSKDLGAYAEENHRDTPEHELLTESFVGCMQRHFKRITTPKGFFGYGASVDRQICGGVIPFSATLILIVPTLESCLLIGRS